MLAGDELALVTVGFAVIGSLLWLSYRYKLQTQEHAGATTEMSALLTYVVGALVSHGQFWIATTLTIIAVLLLELKSALEDLVAAVAGRRDFHLHKVSSADRRHLARCAQSDVWLVRLQSIQDVAGRRGRERRLLRQLLAAKVDEAQWRHPDIGCPRQPVFPPPRRRLCLPNVRGREVPRMFTPAQS